MYTQVKPKINPLPMQSKCNTGFTLVELMVAIIVLAILAGIAVPALYGQVANSRIKERTQRLGSQIQQARSEALRTNGRIYVCALSTSSNLQVQGCKSPNGGVADWGQGVLVYSDNTSGGTKGDYDGMGDFVSLVMFDNKVQVTSSTNQLTFVPTGRELSGQGATFIIKDEKTNACRTLLMSSSGRSRVCNIQEANCDAC